MSFYCGEKYVSDEVFGEKNVIKAIDRVSGETVALKRWPEESPEAQKEISVWQRGYPDVFRDTCREAPYLYLIRRWIDGVPLDRYRAARSRLSGEDALRLFGQILTATESFYARAYAVHGDIKPENILVSEETESAVLLDFETAERTQDRPPEGGSLNTAKTLHFVSRAYSAPEAYHGELTGRSDIYSLGMIFLFLTAGSPQRERIAGLPDEAAAFCRRCTETDPDMRYRDLSEVKAAAEKLREVFSGAQEKKESAKDGARIVSVENMNVTARNVQYAFPPAAEPGGESRTGSGREEDGPDAGGESKIVPFPKNMTGYRRMILYVPGNPAFAAELAYMAAQLFGMKTGLFEICDYDNSVLDYYLTVRSRRGEPAEPFPGRLIWQAAEDSAGPETGDAEELPYRLLLLENAAYWENAGLIAPCEENEELYLSLCDILSELAIPPEHVTDFAVWCYSHFDITVLADRARLKTAQSVALMRYSDYLLIPVRAEIDRIESGKRFFRHFLKQYAIPRAKIRYVGWEFDEKCCTDHEAMVSALGENIYLGTVGYDKDRGVLKNIRGVPYCVAAKPWIRAQYRHIISRFLFDGLKSA